MNWSVEYSQYGAYTASTEEAHSHTQQTQGTQSDLQCKILSLQECLLIENPFNCFTLNSTQLNFDRTTCI